MAIVHAEVTKAKPKPKRNNQFGNFEQRDYDFNELEQAILNKGKAPNERTLEKTQPVESKAKQEPFVKYSKKIKNLNLSRGAKALYGDLKILENDFNKTGKLFYVTDDELTIITGTSKKTIAKDRNELIEAGVLKAGKKHFDTPSGKKSEKLVMHYQFEQGFNHNQA